MGAGVTDLFVFHQKQIRLSASLPLGGDYITSDIMHALNVGRAHAEEIKRYYSRLDKKSLRGMDIILDCNDYGTMDKKIAFDFLHDVVESRVEELVALVHHYLSPVLSGISSQQLYLTGGSALMPSVPETFEKFLNLPVHIITPGVAREYSYPGNTACIGLLNYAASHQAIQNPVVSSRPGIFARIRDLFRA
jgi:cell division protein FtsA